LSGIEPFYFEVGDESLFGCYHAPTPPMRDCGFVFCNARGHEYIQFHRVYRQLAIVLADLGFPVLRFDLRGTGDSAGDFSRWRVDGWVTDVGAAVDELKRRVAVPRIALVGLRIGGALAVMAGAARGDVDALVLWDPVLSGAAYLEELDDVHRGMLGFAHVIPRKRGRGEPAQPKERLGFPMPEALERDILALDLLASSTGAAVPAKRALLIESHTTVRQQPLVDALAARGVAVELRHFDNKNLWAWVEDFAKVHVPHRILESIASWASEEYA
jgi:pimeloyl-ACP methyl ester carboxylesterase